MRAPEELRRGSSLPRRQLVEWLGEERAAIKEQLTKADDLGSVRNLQGRAQMLQMLLDQLDAKP